MAITDNLAWGFKLDETSGGLIELVGGLDLTELGTIGSVTGKVGNARSFNFSDSRATRSNNSAFQLGDIDWTHVGWAYPTSFSFGIRGTIVAKTDTTSSAEWETFFQTDGTLRCQFNGNATSSNTASLNTWNFWAVRYNAASDELNVRLGTTYTNFTSMPASPTDTTAFWIGGETTSGSPYLLFSGYLDEMFGWKRRLSDTELDTIYNGGAGLAYPWVVANPAVDADYSLFPKEIMRLAL